MAPGTTRSLMSGHEHGAGDIGALAAHSDREPTNAAGAEQSTPAAWTSGTRASSRATLASLIFTGELDSSSHLAPTGDRGARRRDRVEWSARG